MSGSANAQETGWMPDVVLTELILDVTDTLSNGVVGAEDTHYVGFNTTLTPLRDSAIIWISFPNGFDIAGIFDVIYSDDDNGNNSNEPVVQSWTNFNQTLKCYLNSGSDPADAGSRISFEIQDLVNSDITGQYAVTVFASDSLDNITHGPAVSAPFTLIPDEIDHIIISPGEDTSVAAGSSIFFNAQGYDEYDNIITGLTFTYAVTVDSCGDIVDGVFTADKLGSCFVTASNGGVTGYSGQITVIPGPFDRFAITGTPAQRIAGRPFPNPVIVTVYDIRDNIKNDYSGIIWFDTDDTSSLVALPFDSGSPFSFPADSAGVAAFAGGGFILVTAGTRVVTVTDGTSSANSYPIIVAAGDIASFELEAGLNQTAGQSFQLSVPFESAVDSFGNLASGTILITDSIGGGSSPGGVPTAINIIKASLIPSSRLSVNFSLPSLAFLSTISFNPFRLRSIISMPTSLISTPVFSMVFFVI